MNSFKSTADTYLLKLHECFSSEVLDGVERLAEELLSAWVDGRNIFICGNGGSAANAIHLANDLHYGIGACGTGPRLPGAKVEALSANSGVLTCLANDTGYENIYSHQLEVKGERGDLLIALSGSGNSENIVRALETASLQGLTSFAIVAFSGGRCRDLADEVIHIKINDMQIAEDSQLIVGHLCMQWLSKNKPSRLVDRQEKK